MTAKTLAPVHMMLLSQAKPSSILHEVQLNGAIASQRDKTILQRHSPRLMLVRANIRTTQRLTEQSRIQQSRELLKALKCHQRLTDRIFSRIH